jgi:proline dehydrogenase
MSSIFVPVSSIMVSFDNTQVAFSAKSDSDLNRSYWLFKLVSNPSLVRFGRKATDLAIGIHFPIGWAIKPTIFKQFCGGENIEECNRTIEQLGKFNIGAILDYSVEGKESESDFDACTSETIATVDKAKGNTNIPFCVFKITGLARFDLLEKVSAGEALSENEQKEFERVEERVNKICKRAFENNVSIFIDAEESWIQLAMDKLANKMMSHYNKQRPIVYNTFQLYRKDRLDYLKLSFDLARQGEYFLGAKLVRGAYMEKERKRAAELGYASPIQDSKENTDQDYNAALRFCAEHIEKIGLCAGTHNEGSSTLLLELMKEKNISPANPHVYFSQLFGMSDHISYNLAGSGYNVAKYVPYGPVKEVLPYLIRRAEENTSVKGQTGRELSLIIKEKKRRAAK